MAITRRRVAGPALAGWIALAALAPAAAQEVGIAAPGSPLPQQFAFQTRTPIVIGDFGEPRLVRVCVTSDAPASPNIGAWVIADGSQIVVSASNCGEVVGARITLEPAGELGGNRLVSGFYSIVG
jgi:hypothetical protein